MNELKELKNCRFEKTKLRQRNSEFKFEFKFEFVDHLLTSQLFRLINSKLNHY